MRRFIRNMVLTGMLVLPGISAMPQPATPAGLIPGNRNPLQEGDIAWMPASTSITADKNESGLSPAVQNDADREKGDEVLFTATDTNDRGEETGVSPAVTDSAALNMRFEGMLAGWVTASYSNTMNGQAGIRYIPGLSAGYKLGKSLILNAEASVNTIGAFTFWSDDSTHREARLKPYRMWLRFSGDRFELRAGLQKINFGSAAMLRPLMWFDQIDPRDPLQLTDGVYALLGRYYFLNNASIWLWGLYGNSGRKGWDMVPSDKKKIEYGGRIQVPVMTIGELALTGHHRMADFRNTDITDTRTGASSVSENRIGLDGKFDLGPGIWFEGTLTHQRIEQSAFSRFLNIGMDYTFGLGNGLHLMMEYLSFGTAGEIFGPADEIRFAALSASYPVSIFTTLNAIVFYDTDNRNLYNFINWSWQFDKWSIYLMGFWNPERFMIYRNLEGTSLFAGKGLQVMFVYNH